MLFDAPQPVDRCVALGLAVAISGIFAIAVPLAAVPLVRVPAFIPLYEGAVVINDLLTGAAFAALFAARGERGLLFLAAGCLWTALLATAHLFSFPGVFTPTGLWAGPQTTAWLYMAWHIGFPTAVILYAAADGRTVRLRQRALVIAGLAVAITAVGVVVLSTGGHALLPAIMQRDDEKPLASLICGGICLVAAFAMGRVLGGHQSPPGYTSDGRAVLSPGVTRLDLSLAVVMYAWIGDVALSGVFNARRYDLGWYAGRFFGFLAVSLVLYHMLLLTVVAQYRRARWLR
jgi:two-component system, sensor histidine kinase and response regulator